MPHITTGARPAYLFYKRHIRIKFDLILQNATDYVHVKHKSGYYKFQQPGEFHFGKKVTARNFIPNTKWKIVKIVQILSKLHYKTKVGVNTWKRYIDQILNVGLNGNLTNDTNKEVDNKNIPLTEKESQNRLQRWNLIWFIPRYQIFQIQCKSIPDLQILLI